MRARLCRFSPALGVGQGRSGAGGAGRAGIAGGLLRSAARFESFCNQQRYQWRGALFRPSANFYLPSSVAGMGLWA